MKEIHKFHGRLGIIVQASSDSMSLGLCYKPDTVRGLENRRKKVRVKQSQKVIF